MMKIIDANHVRVTIVTTSPISYVKEKWTSTIILDEN